MSHKFLPSEICYISSKGEQENFLGLYAFSPGRNYILCSYWAAVPVLVYWTMKKHGHEIDLE